MVLRGFIPEICTVHPLGKYWYFSK